MAIPSSPDFLHNGNNATAAADGHALVDDGVDHADDGVAAQADDDAVRDLYTIDGRRLLPKASSLSDVTALRARARERLEDGAVTDSYAGDRDVVVALLNDALATEIICVLRYKRHYFMARGLTAAPIKAEFLEHAIEEQAHADRLAERIVQLGGAPDLNPDSLSARAHAEYVEGTDLRDMVREDLVAERVAIDSYRAMIDFIGAQDSTTRRLLEGILEQEEQHADELADLLDGFTGR